MKLTKIVDTIQKIKEGKTAYNTKVSTLVLQGLLWSWSELSAEDLFTVFRGPKVPKRVLEAANNGDNKYKQIAGTGETTIYKETSTGLYFCDNPGEYLDEQSYIIIFNKSLL